MTQDIQNEWRLRADLTPPFLVFPGGVWAWTQGSPAERSWGLRSESLFAFGSDNSLISCPVSLCCSRISPRVFSGPCLSLSLVLIFSEYFAMTCLTRILPGFHFQALVESLTYSRHLGAVCWQDFPALMQLLERERNPCAKKSEKYWVKPD